ncbi:hypothetical protein [Rhodococcoides fascians]|uniref:hypothetical protein n=1 Tax=Rhodococcoides fascians TaxID=1828 RepID=UPI000B1860E7|nr:hypothetical protein [Rhodococcus fascians]
MSAINTPRHPANDGRGAPGEECPAFRRINKPIVDELGGNGQPVEWRIDCSLKAGHPVLHTDPSGHRWESVEC